jgi:hypothetical protein
LRLGKEAAVRVVNEKREDLVRRFAQDLDGAAAAEQKALAAAERTANEPWDERVEAAAMTVAQARQKRLAYIQANLDRLLTEMAQPARDWPQRVREALDRLHAVAREYEQLGMPMERLAREVGRDARMPDNPLDVRAIRRMTTVELHAPVPAQAAGVKISVFDDPDDEIRETARARFIAENEGRAA